MCVRVVILLFFGSVQLGNTHNKCIHNVSSILFFYFGSFGEKKYFI